MLSRARTDPAAAPAKNARCLLNAGEIAKSRPHLDRAIALYNPAEHRPLATTFGQDARVAALSFRSPALWMLGYPEAALADTKFAIEDAREIGQAASLMNALAIASMPHIFCGNYGRATAILDELFDLADEKGAFFWKFGVMLRRGELFALTGKAADAVQTITSGIPALRSTGSSIFVPWWLSHLAIAEAELGQFDDAWRCIDEAMTTVEKTKDRPAPHRRRHRAEVARAQARASARLLRARARTGAQAAGKVLGTARGNELGAALARAGQARGGAGTSRSSL